MNTSISLDIRTLLAAYGTGSATPTAVINEVYARIAARGDDHVWAHLVPREVALAQAKHLEKAGSTGKPLYGIPFCVKDNIHVAGLPTTAGCPAFSAIAGRTSTAVQNAIDAGAILIGKNTLDQFATGLVGIRSPGGYCRNTFDPDYIPGGSSSGSGVAVAAGLVSFAFGSDTGGSGRVPAALNNIVGLKPTVGLVSSAGMVYCNRTFDCMPVFALTCEDAWRVLGTIRGYDPSDPYSRQDAGSLPLAVDSPVQFRFAIPAAEHLTFFGDSKAKHAFSAAQAKLQALGGVPVEIDFAPFVEAGNMVFDTPLVAERFVAYGQFVLDHPEEVLSVTRAIIGKAQSFSAVDAYRTQYRLQELKHEANRQLERADVLIVPTTGTIYRCDEVEADPVALNTNMGYYTYFVNPLDLCALAVPAGLRSDGLPHGVSVIARAGQDGLAYAIGRRLQAIVGGKLGATRFGLGEVSDPAFA